MTQNSKSFFKVSSMTELSEREIIIIACIAGVVLLFVLGLALWFFCYKQNEPPSASTKYDALAQNDVKEAEDIGISERDPMISTQMTNSEPRIQVIVTSDNHNHVEHDAKDTPKGHMLISVQHAIDNDPDHIEPVPDYELQYKEKHLMHVDDDDSQSLVEEHSHVSLVEGILSYDAKQPSHDHVTPLVQLDSGQYDAEEEQQEKSVFAAAKAVKSSMAANNANTDGLAVSTEPKTKNGTKHVQAQQNGLGDTKSVSIVSDPNMVIVSSSYKREIAQFEAERKQKEDDVQQRQATRVRESVEDMLMNREETLNVEDEVEQKEVMDVISKGQEALSGDKQQQQKEEEDQFQDEYEVETLDADMVKELRPHKLQTVKSDISISASTQSVLRMDSEENLFADRFDRGGFEFDADGDSLRETQIVERNPYEVRTEDKATSD